MLVSLGMAGYAKIQKWGFYGGLLGFGVVLLLLAINNHASFVSSFNLEAHKIFGVAQRLPADQRRGAQGVRLRLARRSGSARSAPSMLLVPMMMFYLLWPNWGSTLYGEIRGASDFRRVFAGMFGGLWITVALSVLFLVLINKTMGQAFYNNTGALYWNLYGGKVRGDPIWPYPVMFIGWLVHNQIFQVVLLVVMFLWFIAWVGTLFLSSTRVIFAAAFDRILPDRAAEVSEKRKVPMYSLVLMLLPAVGLSAVYAYWSKFYTYTLDATLVIAVTYLFTAIAVVLLPFIKKDLWRGLAGQQDQAARRADRAGRRLDHDRPARVQPLRMADQRPTESTTGTP